MSDTIEIKLNNADAKIDNLKSGELNKLSIKTKFEVTVIEMEDINFHFDSAVLLPDYGTEGPEDNTAEQNRITGLGVLFTSYKQAEKKEFLQKILVAGHTDKKGGEFYNLTLSQQRAENVFFMFMGERNKWADSSNEKHQVEDIQQILKWISFNFRYDCDPGEKTNKMNAETTGAILAFQKRYNEDFVVLEKHKEKFSRLFTKIDEDGKMGKQTWKAFFDMYTLELLIVMGITEDGLNELRTKLNFVKKSQTHPAPVVGCGESFPASGATSEEANAVDRRVEFLFFDEGEEPELKCHPKKFQCIKSKCDLHPEGFFKRNPVPAEPLPLPSGMAVRVHLKFIYKTPDEKERSLPKDFPYTLKFQDGTTEERKIETDNGQIFLQVLREKKAFTIEFKFAEKNFIASPEDDTQKDELVKEAGVKEKIKNGFKVFNLPLQFNLKTSVWELSPSVSNFDDTEKQFKDLDNLSVENIGSEASPIKMILDPKWQHLKFTYFDRQIKKRLSLLPFMVEGLSTKADATPTSQSNWLDATEECQCLPWIDQTSKKPNANTQLRFRFTENTFIESSGNVDSFSRKYVTKNPSSSTDAGLNEGSGINLDFDIMNANRMKFYDLPKLWKSQTYFCQQPAEAEGSDAEKKLFESMVTKQTTLKRPLVFSLDDIVLFVGDSSGKITSSFDWDGSSLAVFCNTFKDKNAEGIEDTINLTKFGLFKPVTNSDFFSKKEVTVTRTDKLAHIVDYPDWVRVVFVKGNFFDAFDLRSPDTNNGVVGARAAVRWIDSSKLIPPNSDKDDRPGITHTRKTSAVQPVFKQIHDFHGRIGRVDLILLRCCDVDGDTEIGANIHYLRFHFAFNFALTDDEKKINRVASTKTGAQADIFKNNTCTRIMNRWNGNDNINNRRAKILPKDEKFGKLSCQVLWFVQALTDADKNLTHYTLKVFNDDAGRAFMSSKGFGELNEKHTSANPHEAGHGDSLVDEYVERWRSASYQQPGFYSFSPGSPFDFDSEAMMNGNLRIRARYFWHAAEWFNKVYNAEFVVHRRIHKFNIPTHPNKTDKTFVSFPVKNDKDVKSGERGKFDLFLYKLGEDEFPFDILRNHPTKGKATIDPFDSILMILVKMRFEFHTDTHATIKNGVANINSAIFDQFNQKFFAESKQLKLERCLLHFFPRYLVKNYSGDAELNGDMGITKKSEYNSRVSEIKSEHGLHFDVETKTSGTSEWKGKNDLNFLFNAGAPAKFPRFFAHMVGIPDNKEEEASSYEPIAKILMPDAKISKVFP